MRIGTDVQQQLCAHKALVMSCTKADVFHVQCDSCMFYHRCLEQGIGQACVHTASYSCQMPRPNTSASPAFAEQSTTVQMHS